MEIGDNDRTRGKDFGIVFPVGVLRPQNFEFAVIGNLALLANVLDQNALESSLGKRNFKRSG